MCDAVTFKNALNLIDTDHYYMSGIEVFQFPGGEWHANVPAWTTDSVHVWAKLRTWDDVEHIGNTSGAGATEDVVEHL